MIVKDFSRGFSHFTIVMAALIATSGTAHATIVIDDFNTDPMLVTPGTSPFAGPASSAIGGFRTLEIVKSGLFNASIDVLVPPGVYTHNADVFTSASSTITWDSGGAGLGGINLTEGLVNNRFEFDILSIDQSIALTVTVTDTTSASSTVTFSGASVGTESVPFAAFIGNANFESIDSIALDVVGGEGADLALDSLSTSGDVPDPGIDIRKQEEGPDSRTFAPGDTVPFEIQVTNTGNVLLTGVQVFDPLIPQLERIIGNLAVDESVTYTGSTVLAGDAGFVTGFVNEACVEGSWSVISVSDCDTSEVVVEGGNGNVPIPAPITLIGFAFAGLGYQHRKNRS